MSMLLASDLDRRPPVPAEAILDAVGRRPTPVVVGGFVLIAFIVALAAYREGAISMNSTGMSIRMGDSRE